MKQTIKEMKRLNKLPYKEFLETDYWKKLSRTVKDEADNMCQLCSESEKVLHAHHRRYDHRGCFPEEICDVICLCEDCHSMFHKKTKSTSTKDEIDLNEKKTELIIGELMTYHEILGMADDYNKTATEMAADKFIEYQIGYILSRDTNNIYEI